MTGPLCFVVAARSRTAPRNIVDHLTTLRAMSSTTYPCLNQAGVGRCLTFWQPAHDRPRAFAAAWRGPGPGGRAGGRGGRAAPVPLRGAGAARARPRQVPQDRKTVNSWTAPSIYARCPRSEGSSPQFANAVSSWRKFLLPCCGRGAAVGCPRGWRKRIRRRAFSARLTACP